MEIRKAKKEELPVIMSIFQDAREFMAQSGNPTQWGKSYPEKKLIEQDIADGKCHVCLYDGQIVGTFYFAKEEDETYQKIEDGNWLNDKEYAVVHRVAIRTRGLGVASQVLNWAYSQYPNVKIDTHRNNKAMQATVTKNGFQYCGIIHLANGEERLAYQRA